MDPLFSTTDLSAAPAANPELAVLANPDALAETGDADTEPMAFAALLENQETEGESPETDALVPATLSLEELMASVETGKNPDMDNELEPPSLPKALLSGQAADVLPAEQNQSTGSKLGPETVPQPILAQRVPGLVTEPQPGATIEADTPNPDIRRQADGQVVFQDEFPPGWEVLLEDALPAKVGPRAQSSMEAEGLETLQEALPELSTPDQPARLKTQSASASSEGPDLTGNLKPAQGRPEPSATLSTHSQAQPGVRTEAEPALRMEIPTSPAGEVKSETLAVEWTSTATQATKSVAPTPSQTLSQLTEVQKQLAIKEFALGTLKGINSKQEQLTVELHPPDLGKVRVVVKSSGDNIHAQLTLQDQAVGEFFQERLEALRKSLEEAGIRLGNLSVEIKQNHQWETPGQEEQGSDDIASGKTVGQAKRSGVTRSPVRTPALAGQGKVDLLL